MGDRAIREQVAEWMGEMRQAASSRPGTGACAVGTALSLWTHVYDWLQRSGEGTATHAPALTEALGWLLSSGAFVLQSAAADDPFVSDLCHAQVARAYADVIEADGSHPAKAGPCVKFDGMEEFVQIRSRLDACLSGATLARERAAGRLLGA